ncbi:MAG: carboxypeptidase-like regulatory domain-containing protein [Saprospiraceae bacterium]|nr:carboxypeptidase-like regulatory domain-containing protein [Saprospiraceae bacterium]
MIRRTQSFVVFILIMFNTILTFGQSISGKLLDTQTQTPQAGVQLLIENTDLQTFTNGAGSFKFENVKSGTYNILAKYNNQLFIVSTLSHDGKKDLDLGNLNFTAPTTFVADDISVVDVSDLAGMEAENDNFSSALSAGRDPFVNATTFNLSAGRFRPRGYFNEDSEMFMNGMVMNDQDDGRVLWTAWNGMNDMIRTRTNQVNMNESDYTFGGIGGSTFIDLRASSIRNENKISYAHSNRTFQHRLMGSYVTGLMKNGWAIAASASHSYADRGYVPGTYMQGNSYFLSVDRKLNDRHLLNFVAFGSPQKRGRSSGAIQEMYDLAGSNYYNPNWGYQNGEVRNSREYIIHQPVTMLRHDWKISANTNLMTTVGYQFGNYGSTRLDWYDAPDPRPDYYRKLPSYALDQANKDLVTAFYKESEENRQLNWHAMYDANATRNYTILNVDGIEGNTVEGKLAAYVQESENYDNKKFSFNSVINSAINSKLKLTAGLQYLDERVHYYRRLEDLLGADFYLDFNRFALRDFPANPDAGQNDLNRPNRIVQEGDIYGHNYNINNQRATAWGQLALKTDNFDYFAAISVANQSFYREGFAKVGLFPESSYGKSEVQSFFNYSAKGGITYKLDGRNYFALNGSYRTRAPLANEVYLSPRVRNQIASNITNEKITSLDLSYLARYTDFKARVTLFYTDFKDKITNDVFIMKSFRHL